MNLDDLATVFELNQHGGQLDSNDVAMTVKLGRHDRQSDSNNMVIAVKLGRHGGQPDSNNMAVSQTQTTRRWSHTQTIWGSSQTCTIGSWHPNLNNMTMSVGLKQHGKGSRIWKTWRGQLDLDDLADASRF